MSILEKFNLDPKEKKLIKKVTAISSVVFLIFIVTIGTFNFIKMRKISAKIKKVKVETNKIQTISLRTFYATKTDDLLPIDIEAHKIAALSKDINSSIKNKIEHLTRISAAEPNNYQISINLAEVYIEAGLYSNAELIFEDVFETSETSEIFEPRILAMYGLTLFYTGKFEKSYKYLSDLINSKNVCKEAYCYLGQVEVALNRATSKAEKYFREAIKLDPDYSEGAYQLARYYMNKPSTTDNDLHTARKLLLQIISKEPLNEKAHSRLGMVYFYLGQPSLAEKSYLTALTLNRQDYNTRFNLGELYFSEFKNNTKALLQFKQTIALDSTHVNANYKAGLIMLENGQNKEALSFLETAGRGEPENVRILFQQAVAFENLNMKERAKQIYTRILSIDKLNDIALQKLKLLKGI